jgi:hypothetical protein
MIPGFSEPYFSANPTQEFGDYKRAKTMGPEAIIKTRPKTNPRNNGRHNATFASSTPTNAIATIPIAIGKKRR